MNIDPPERHLSGEPWSAFSAAEWQSINTLGHAIDDDLERLQVGLTMGGEPTYVSATDLASLQWRYQALGDDKRELANDFSSVFSGTWLRSVPYCTMAVG